MPNDFAKGDENVSSCFLLYVENLLTMLCALVEAGPESQEESDLPGIHCPLLERGKWRVCSWVQLITDLVLTF